MSAWVWTKQRKYLKKFQGRSIVYGMDKDEAIKFCDWWTTIQPICVGIAQPLSDVDLMNAFLLASYSHHLIIPYLSTICLHDTLIIALPRWSLLYSPTTWVDSSRTFGVVHALYMFETCRQLSLAYLSVCIHTAAPVYLQKPLYGRLLYWSCLESKTAMNGSFRSARPIVHRITEYRLLLRRIWPKKIR